jgi:hypothetical protein
MKTILVLTVIVFALTFGLAVAWADEVRFGNGITFSDTGPAPDCESITGMGAGGLIVEEPGEAVVNGVTVFELSMPGSVPTGRCAGATELSLPVSNGVTVFEE